MDAAADTAWQEADGVAAKTQAGVPKSSVSARRRGDCVYQSDPARLGAVLCGRSCESLLLLHLRLGGKEDSVPLGSSKPATWFRVEAVESRMAVRHAGTVSRVLRGVLTGPGPLVPLD